MHSHLVSIVPTIMQVLLPDSPVNVGFVEQP